MDTLRQKKISRLLLKELSTIFQRESSSFIPGGMITVTTVRVSPDLGLAKVYLSIFPSGKTDETILLISENTKSIRFQLGKLLRHQLRVIPELQFFVDDSLDYAERINELLND